MESALDDKDHNEQSCKQLNSDDQNFISGQGKTYANGLLLCQPPKLAFFGAFVGLLVLGAPRHP